MPTHEEDERFTREFNGLNREEKPLFRKALRDFLEDADNRFRHLPLSSVGLVRQ